MYIHMYMHAYRCIHLCSNMFICVTTAGMDCCVPSHSVSGSRYWAWSGNRVFSFSDYHSDYFVSKAFVCVLCTLPLTYIYLTEEYFRGIQYTTYMYKKNLHGEKFHIYIHTYACISGETRYNFNITIYFHVP